MQRFKGRAVARSTGTALFIASCSCTPPSSNDPTVEPSDAGSSAGSTDGGSPSEPDSSSGDASTMTESSSESGSTTGESSTDESSTDESSTDESSTDESSTGGDPIEEDHFFGPKLGRSAGCPMFHCDFQGTSLMYNRVPRGALEVLWDDGIPNSRGAQGCSSHGTTFACVYRGSPPGGTLQIYSTTGDGPPARVGSSALVGQGGSTAIAPLVSPDGDVITADVRSTIRVRIDGTLVWQTPAPANVPPNTPNAFGPTLTLDNQVVVAYTTGTLAAYDAATGALLSTAGPLADGMGGFYRTSTPPVSSGNRIYVAGRSSTATGTNTAHGVLFAYDADREAGTLTLAWQVQYGGPTGGSPYVDAESGLILLHVRSEAPNDVPMPHMLTIVDEDTAARVVWAEPMSGDLRVSPAKDPRGGAWASPEGSNALFRFDPLEGLVGTLPLEQLVAGASDDAVIGHLYTAVDPNGPTLITTIADSTSAQLIAVDLVSESLVWSVPLALTNASYTGALPLVRNGSDNALLLVSPATEAATGLGVRLLGLP